MRASVLLLIALLTFNPSLLWPDVAQQKIASNAPLDKPLKVKVLGTSHHNFEPITLDVTNVTAMSIDLAVPYNLLKDSEHFPNPLPIDIERHEGNKWIVTRPSGQQRGGPQKIRPQQTVEFTLGIVGIGEYRARVWYFVDHGDPPQRMPKTDSVISSSFQIETSSTP